MLRRRTLAVLCGAALAAATTSLPAGASSATGRTSPPARAAHRTLHVAPALGLPGLAVRFYGDDVPHKVSYRVYFDVTTSDKVPLCAGKVTTATRWACSGRIPHRYGALGLHTVEMDAIGATGKGGFIELSSFLVTDLGVSMSAPATTAPGDTVQFRVTASNGNAVVARGVHLVDGVPGGLRATKVTGPCTLRHGVVRCGPLRLGVRRQLVVTITAIVTVQHPTHLFDRVTISGSPDPLHRNDSVRVELTVT